MSSPDVKDKLADLSDEGPLPPLSGKDRIRLIGQSPFKLYLYWSHANDPFASLNRAFSAQKESYDLIVKFVELESGREKLFVASPTLTHWFNDVRPGFSYVAHIGFHAEGRPFIRILTSNVVKTPRAGFVFSQDSVKLCSASVIDFARLLNEAGYARTAIEYLLMDADQLTGWEASRTIAIRFKEELEERYYRTYDIEAPDKKQVLDERHYKAEDLRALLADIAGGKTYDDFEHQQGGEQFSDSLQSWLDLVYFFSDCQTADCPFDTLLLMGIIQSVVCRIFNRPSLSLPDEAPLITNYTWQ